MNSRWARWRLRRYQLNGFRRDLFSQMWEPVEVSEGLWARPRFNIGLEELPIHLRDLLAKLDLDDREQAPIAQGWIGLSPGTNPDFREILGLAGRVLAQNGVTRLLPESGLSFETTLNAGFFPGLVFGKGAFVSLNVGLLQSIDHINEWVLGASDLHYGSADLMPGVEAAYLDAIYHALPFMLGLAPTIMGMPGDARRAAFQQAVLESHPGFHRYARMGHRIAMTQKIWIVLHEFAHWHLGHRGMTGMGSHYQEHEADRQALQWLLHSEANHKLLKGIVPSEVAIPTLFDILRCGERLYPRQSDTHPSFEDRWHHITTLTEVNDHWSGVGLDPQLSTYLFQRMEEKHG